MDGGFREMSPGEKFDITENETYYQKEYLTRDLGQKVLASLDLSGTKKDGGFNLSDNGEGENGDNNFTSISINKINNNLEEEAEKEDSAERTREILPVFDTPETIAEHREKLKKGIKIVVGGPPHSGKSVFIEGLMANLDRSKTFSFSAAPDGEGAWLQKHYDNPDVVKWRRKGKFTSEFVAD